MGGLAGNLEVMEVVLDDGTLRDRFVICGNPEAAERDHSVRAQLLEQLQAAIADSHDKPLGDRPALVQSLRAKPRHMVPSRRSACHAISPPSITMDWPVMYAASGEARNANSAAISSGVACRPSGMLRSTSSSISLVYSACCMGVST